LSSPAITQRPGPALRRKILWWWFATFLWLSCQALFSTDAFSAEHTGTILWKIVHAIYGAISSNTFETIHFLVRKTAHFTTYGLLSVLAFFAWRATVPSPQRWTPRWSVLAVIMVFIAGSIDEFHQSFVASRTSSFRDVLLDTFGALCFQLVLATVLMRKERRAAALS
jgi:VanZ family protein